MPTFTCSLLVCKSRPDGQSNASCCMGLIQHSRLLLKDSNIVYQQELYVHREGLVSQELGLIIYRQIASLLPTITLSPVSRGENLVDNYCTTCTSSQYGKYIVGVLSLFTSSTWYDLLITGTALLVRIVCTCMYSSWYSMCSATSLCSLYQIPAGTDLYVPYLHSSF